MPGLGRFPSIHRPVLWRNAHAMEDHARLYSDEELASLQPKFWATGSILDQDTAGDDPAHPYCVGFGGSDHLRGEPHRHPDLDPGGLVLYAEAQKYDGIRGWHQGSTAEGLLEALARRGLATRDTAVWATNEWVIRSYLLNYGPVMMATSWWTSMFTPDAEGIVHANIDDPDNDIAGGHLWSLVGYDWNCFGKLPRTEHGLYLCMNHWGNQWGVPRPDVPNGEAGYFLISHGDLAFLAGPTYEGEALAIANWSGVPGKP